ncbi:MAG TPA: ABC transporter permease [Flavilitoribacter sp.]|nr:ABC transporter permease [Flavilitoribacter sp.]HMQ88418.1 ABC transporter permease [Flavilitoribacter sp.]
MLQNYFKIAWRNLNRNRRTSLIHVLGLALGLSACVVIYLITSYELQFDRFHPDSNRIYRLVGKVRFGEGEEGPVGFVPYALPAAFREAISHVETVAAFHNIETSVRIPNGEGEPLFFAQRRWGVDRAEIILAEPQYFDIFQYQWLAGNPETALNTPNKVVLSAKKAHKYFGDLPLQEMMGKEVIYMDSLKMTVSGIVQDWDKPSDLTFTDFLSFSTLSASFMSRFYNLNEWNDIWSASQAFVKLPEKTDPAAVEARFPAFMKDRPTGQMHYKLGLQPLSGLHFDAGYGDNYSRKAHLPTLYGMMLIALFILILASINFINLSTAQSLHRSREVGIRKVLGSGRQRLMLQFLTETLLLTAVALALSLALVPKILQTFQSYIPEGVALHFTPQTILFLVSIALGTALLAGFYPSFVLSSFLPALILKGQSSSAGTQRGILRKALIVFQFAVSLVFILGTVLVSRQISYMRHKDLGFNSDAVLTLQAPRGPANQLEALYPKISQLPGVAKTTRQIFEPMGINYGVDKVFYKEGGEHEFDAAYKMGDENFIPFYEMKILAGRNLMPSDTAREFVINESFVKALGFSQPSEAIGVQLQWHDKFYPVVGVVGDFHQLSLHEKIAPTFITTPKRFNNLAVKLSGRDPEAVRETISRIGDLWKEVYPDHPFGYTFLDDTIAQFFEKERKTGSLVNRVTFISLFISCLGLYGLSTFTVTQRAKEISIRKILGSSVTAITGLLTRDFLWLVMIASVIAFPVAWYFMHGWLEDFAYHVQISWWMFAMAGIVSLAAVLVTVGFQSVKAALANPVKSLRNE